MTRFLRTKLGHVYTDSGLGLSSTGRRGGNDARVPITARQIIRREHARLDSFMQERLLLKHLSGSTYILTILNPCNGVIPARKAKGERRWPSYLRRRAFTSTTRPRMHRQTVRRGIDRARFFGGEAMLEKLSLSPGPAHYQRNKPP